MIDRQTDYIDNNTAKDESMSLKTWKKEFYPVPAGEIKKHDKIGAIEHSILKWEGLKAKNLAKHEVRRVASAWSADIEEATNIPRKFDIDGFTCALCQIASAGCDECPIVIATGFACTAAVNGAYGAFSIWRINSDPNPMLKVLKKTLKFYQKK